MEQVWLNDVILLSSGYLSSLNSLWGEVMRAHFWIFVVSHFSTSPTLWSHWLVTAAFNMTWISWLWRRNGRWMNSWWWLQEKIHVPPKWDICMNILSTSCQFVLYLNAAITSKITIIKIPFPHSNYSQFSTLQLQWFLLYLKTHIIWLNRNPILPSQEVGLTAWLLSRGEPHSCLGQVLALTSKSVAAQPLSLSVALVSL